MPSDANAAVVGEFFEAFGAGDRERTLALLAPDVTWTTRGQNRLAGSRRGPDAVIEQLGRSKELTGGSYSTEVHDLLTSETGAAVHYTGSGELDGEPFAFEGLLHFKIENGRVREVAFAPLDSQEFDRIWR